MTPDSLKPLFESQKQAYQKHPYPDLSERRRRLRELKALILENQEAIASALDKDFGGRSPHETLNAEILPSIMGINHALRKLKRWMKPKRRLMPLLFQPAWGRVEAQPLGVVGILVPWNYALYLSVGPLISALAAGNHCMVKISEYTPTFGELFARLVGERFDASVLAVINGEVETAQAFSELPFDHLLFTGSTAVGRHIMAAAARNLTPVTLELGGKSPVVIDRSIPIREAAERLVFAKCLNAGQTCVAPDYVLCPSERVEDFVNYFLLEVRRQYEDVLNNPHYSAIINDRQHSRLLGYLQQAEQQGAKLHWSADPPKSEAQGKRMPPVLVTDLNPSTELMQEEIFGPILPVLPYDSPEEALAFINARPRPLALYVFGYDKSLRRRYTEGTHSGGLVFNDALFHVALDNLPFGGVGHSGMGHYHGHDGFNTFSKLKPVVGKQRFSSLKLAYPPYDRWVHRLIKWVFVR